MFFHQVGVAFLVVCLTLWLQSAGIATLLAWLRHAIRSDSHRLFRSAGFLVRFTAAVIALHGLQILLWTSCYRWLFFPAWESALYFSATSYATVGYGDVTPPVEVADVTATREHHWRVVGDMEKAAGSRKA
jgi:voltage-gated potassium channel